MKKCKITLALVLTLLLCLLAAPALAARFGVVTGTDSLNLRLRGSSSSEWLGSYARGTWVEIVGSENNFYCVYPPDGRRGYMSKNYIDTADTYRWTAEVRNQNSSAFLNFRAQPSYNAQVLDIFYNGVPLLVNSSQNGWYCVTINGQTGYVRQEYVVDHQYARMGSGDVYTIKTPNQSALNLRQGPGTRYNVIASFPSGRYVMVLARGSGWSRVSIDGYVGFMSNDFLVKGLNASRDLSANKSTTANARAYAVVSNPQSGQALNLRQYASTGSQVLDKLYNGTRLWVNDQGTEWCAVTDQETGLSGYVMTRYVTLYNLSATPWREVVHPTGSYVNLRSSPTMGANNVQVRVPDGQSVVIVSPGTEWCKVQYNGYTGYMLTYFLD